MVPGTWELVGVGGTHSSFHPRLFRKMQSIICVFALLGLLQGALSDFTRIKECRYKQDLELSGHSVTGPIQGDNYYRRRCVWKFKNKPFGCSLTVRCVPGAANNACVKLKDQYGLVDKACGEQILEYADSDKPDYYYYYNYNYDFSLQTPFKIIFKEGSKYTCTVSCGGSTATTAGTTTTVTPPPPAPGNCKCGLKNNIPARIVGGTEAGKFEFSWQVALVSRGTSLPFCGGSIINNLYVLTAAHCVDAISARDLQAIFLEHDITISEAETIRSDVESIITHSSYNINNNDYDAALLKLKTSLTWTEKLRPVCLPADNSDTYVGKLATVTGWGSLQESGSSPNTLQEVTVPIITNTKCQEQNSFFDITPNMICAGFDSGGKDSCYGDSGGPLVYANGNSHYLIGVVSFGFGCAQQKSPGVYTRVSSILPWIKINTAGATTCPA